MSNSGDSHATADVRRVLQEGGEPMQITASVGVATHWPAAGGHPAQLVRAADQALYLAKRGARNRVQFSND